MVILKDGMASERCCWPFHEVTEDRSKSEGDFAEELRSLVADAVRIRAHYPGAYGTLVSGGVDTSAIAAMLCREFSSRPLHGFSIVFESETYSDAALQQQVYRATGIEAHQQPLMASDFESALAQGVSHLDSPVNDVALVGMYRVMELVRSAGFKAAFEGEGAEEIFCTNHSQAERAFKAWLALPEWTRRLTFGAVFRDMPVSDSLAGKVGRFACRIGMPEYRRLSMWPPVMTDGLRRRMHSATRFRYYPYERTRDYLSSASVKDPLNRYNYLLSRLFLPDDLLYKNERMSAAHGVTNRTPFIDYRLMELGFQIPARFKIRRPTPTADMTKLILKKALDGIVPDAVLHRKKARGFSQPSGTWYRNELRGFAEDLLIGRSSRIRSILDMDAVSAIWSSHLRGGGGLDYHLNAVIILELWLRSHEWTLS